MILFFCYKKSFLKYVSLSLKYFNHDYIVLNSFNKYYFDKACVIIPIGIGAQKRLNDYPEYKKKFLITPERTYEILDDKILFYDYVKKHQLLNNTGVNFIPTYNNY